MHIFVCSQDFKTAVLEDLLRLGKEAGLKTFEQVRALLLYITIAANDRLLWTPDLILLKQKKKCHNKVFIYYDRLSHFRSFDATACKICSIRKHRWLLPHDLDGMVSVTVASMPQ